MRIDRAGRDREGSGNDADTPMRGQVTGTRMTGLLLDSAFSRRTRLGPRGGAARPEHATDQALRTHSRRCRDGPRAGRARAGKTGGTCRQASGGPREQDGDSASESTCRLPAAGAAGASRPPHRRAHCSGRSAPGIATRRASSAATSADPRCLKKFRRSSSARAPRAARPPSPAQSSPTGGSAPPATASVVPDHWNIASHSPA